MIFLRSKAETELLRASGRMVSEVLQALESAIKPGVTTRELGQLAGRLIRDRGGIPAPPQVGFPGDICVSVNNVVVHGVPGDCILHSGDIVSVDVMASLDGYYGDTAATFPVGEISGKAKRLLEITKNALYEGISKAVAGNRVGDISHTIQAYVEKSGFSVVRDFVGHGIGKEMWEKPQVPNFGTPNRGPRLKKGMVLAIEPMVNAGDYEINILDDRWTAVTQDDSLSAHFEHTIIILDDEPEILTCS